MEYCPFCGSEDILVNSDSGYSIQCNDCKARSGVYLSMERAVEAWNKRIFKRYYDHVMQLRKKKHICTVCGKRPAREGLTTCSFCSENHIKRRNERIQYRKDNHLCLDCGNPLDSGWEKLRCQDCLDVRKEKQKQRRDRERNEQ